MFGKNKPTAPVSRAEFELLKLQVDGLAKLTSEVIDACAEIKGKADAAAKQMVGAVEGIQAAFNSLMKPK